MKPTFLNLRFVGLRSLVLCAALFQLLPLLAGTPAEEIEAIRTYQSEVKALTAELHARTNAPAVLLEYLESCDQNASALVELVEASQPDRDRAARKVRDTLKGRLNRRELVSQDPAAWEDPVMRRESDAYQNLVNSTGTLDDLYLEKLVVRKTLLERKYFEDDDPKSGNFLEGLINSKVPLLRYEDGAESWYRQRGVSAFEATIRAEPVVLFNADRDPGILFAGGLLYNFFPGVSQDPENPFAANENHSILSQHVRRIGPRFGLGARTGNSADFMIGGGFQVRAISVWAVYEPRDSQFNWAAGISDWTWLKQLLPIFGK